MVLHYFQNRVIMDKVFKGMNIYAFYSMILNAIPIRVCPAGKQKAGQGGQKRSCGRKDDKR